MYVNTIKSFPLCQTIQFFLYQLFYNYFKLKRIKKEKTFKKRNGLILFIYNLEKNYFKNFEIKNMKKIIIFLN